MCTYTHRQDCYTEVEEAAHSKEVAWDLRRGRDELRELNSNRHESIILRKHSETERFLQKSLPIKKIIWPYCAGGGLVWFVWFWFGYVWVVVVVVDWMVLVGFMSVDDENCVYWRSIKKTWIGINWNIMEKNVCLSLILFLYNYNSYFRIDLWNIFST